MPGVGGGAAVITRRSSALGPTGRSPACGSAPTPRTELKKPQNDSGWSLVMKYTCRARRTHTQTQRYRRLRGEPATARPRRSGSTAPRRSFAAPCQKRRLAQRACGSARRFRRTSCPRQSCVRTHATNAADARHAGDASQQWLRHANEVRGDGSHVLPSADGELRLATLTVSTETEADTAGKGMPHRSTVRQSHKHGHGTRRARLRTRAVSISVGTSWGSRSPNRPCGRREMV